jgi:hypothetical protein
MCARLRDGVFVFNSHDNEAGKNILALEAGELGEVHDALDIAAQVEIESKV